MLKFVEYYTLDLMQNSETIGRDKTHSKCASYAKRLSSAPFYVYKWKNHFVEMKGDVGMSVHEKGGKQVNATPTHKTIYNPIPTSLYKIMLCNRISNT